MATPSPNSKAVQGAATTPRPIVPPEEKFWQRYSPHHELPLSSVGSLTIYILVGLLVYAGIRLSLFDLRQQPLPVDTIEFDPNVGGGSGDPSGATGGTGDKLPENVGVDPAKLAKDQDLPNLPPLLPRPVDAGKIADILPPESKGDDIVAAAPEALGRLGEIEKETARQLLEGLRGKGNGGNGVGTGTGDAKGPGDKKPLTDRQRRVLRWNMVFDTRNGEDYRRQLQSLGAILAIRTATGQYLVIRDLRPPARPMLEDLTKIQRIFWVDNQPQSVQNLATALGLADTPRDIVALFPEELEQKLVDLEKRFAPQRREEEIKETRFRIVFVERTGRYEPMVVEQR
jgi:hypothetical protein